MNPKILKHYLRPDIQKEILKLAKNREVGVKFGDKGYGKRPDILQYPGDIAELAKRGATSFHVSEELWHNPLDLKTGLKKRELDELRKGWTLLLDIDTKFLEYSKITADLLIEAFKFHNVENYSIKFSGGNGIHVAIPFQAFPKKVQDQETRLLFPEGVKVVAHYLQDMIKEHLSQRILGISSIQEIADSLDKPITGLKIKNKFNPFSVVDIDPILISSRHMFRSIYSINEKSGRVSVPINPEKVLDFKLSEAKIENVEVKIPFLDYKDIGRPDAAELIIQAFDWNLKNTKNKVELPKQQLAELPKVAVKPDFFPPCITKMLNGINNDGRKRAIFVLLNFLRHMGWTYEDIKKELLEWNQKNYEPLRENYILAQLSWHKRQNNVILPPNCSNDIYYNKEECHQDHWCNNVKNPVQYVKKKLRVLTKKPRKKREIKPRIQRSSNNS